MSSESNSLRSSPSFNSARALTFPDGTLTPAGLEAVKKAPDDLNAQFEEQNKRIAELMVQVKKLEEENKEAKKGLKSIPADKMDEALRAMGYISDRPGV